MVVIKNLTPTFQEDLKVVRKVIESKSAGSENLKSFEHVGEVAIRLSQRLQGLFRITAEAITPQNRLAVADGVISFVIDFLATIEPMVLGFVSADAPSHVADAVRKLRILIQELRELVDQKEDQAKVFRERNGLGDKT